MSEQDVLKIRDNLKRRLTVEELSKIPLDIGLMNEEGFPHQGFLNYVSPEIDPMTGTILVRGLFNNPNRDLLPGFFVRIRVPHGLGRHGRRCSFPTASSPRTRPASTCWSSTRTMSSSSAASRPASCWSAACG